MATALVDVALNGTLDHRKHQPVGLLLNTEQGREYQSL